MIKHLQSNRPSACSGLTSVAHSDAIVHHEANQGHEHAEHAEEHPVLPQAGERVPPEEAEHPADAARPLAAVVEQLLAPLLVVVLPLLLDRLQPLRLGLGELAQVLRVPAVHLSGGGAGSAFDSDLANWPRSFEYRPYICREARQGQRQLESVGLGEINVTIRYWHAAVSKLTSLCLS